MLAMFCCDIASQYPVSGRRTSRDRLISRYRVREKASVRVTGSQTLARDEDQEHDGAAGALMHAQQPEEIPATAE
jgi:hypothetical protein